MNLDLKPAFELAVEVHGTQRDKAGEPYMGHICRVMSAMDTDAERVVAILHDVLEDTSDWNKWNAITDQILDAYNWPTYFAVKALTRMPDMTYAGYIRHVADSALATKVKLADLRDNTDRFRMEKLAPAERERLRTKYYEAMNYLAKHGALMPALDAKE
jgi:hypothetical protein